MNGRFQRYYNYYRQKKPPSRVLERPGRGAPIDSELEPMSPDAGSGRLVLLATVDAEPTSAVGHQEEEAAGNSDILHQVDEFGIVAQIKVEQQT